MTPTRRLIPLALLTLAACGGGGSDAPTEVAASPPPPVVAPTPSPSPVETPARQPAPTPAPAPNAPPAANPAPQRPIAPNPVPAPTPTPIEAPAPVSVAPSPVVEQPQPVQERPATVQTVDMTCVIRGLFQRIRFTVAGPGEPWSTLTVEPLSESYYQGQVGQWSVIGQGDWGAFKQDPDGQLVSSGQYRMEGETVYLNPVEMQWYSGGDPYTDWRTIYTFTDGQLTGATAIIVLGWYDRPELTCPAEGGPPGW